MLRTLLLLALAVPWAARAAPAIVAAENVYGDVASQLAGPDATVTSILSSPDQDPHLFEASPSVARSLAAATIVVFNGANYDPWLPKLLDAEPRLDRRVINIADLVHRRAGDNPHLWYDLTAMRAFAQALTGALTVQDIEHAAGYAQRGQAFAAALDQLDTRVAALRVRFAGASVTATEPVFGLMAAALGLTMRNERFQRAVMNGTEPRVSDTAAFEDDLVHHRADALLYNSQATSSAARRLLGIGRREGIPVVPISETEPPGTTYQAWVAAELDALDQSLSRR